MCRVQAGRSASPPNTSSTRALTTHEPSRDSPPEALVCLGRLRPARGGSGRLIETTTHELTQPYALSMSCTTSPTPCIQPAPLVLLATGQSFSASNLAVPQTKKRLAVECDMACNLQEPGGGDCCMARLVGTPVMAAALDLLRSHTSFWLHPLFQALSHPLTRISGTQPMFWSRCGLSSSTAVLLASAHC
jgi:hypothetical protein